MLTWKTILEEETKKPYFHDLSEFLGEERRKFSVYPPSNQVFAAFQATPFDSVKVVLFGQDPYHGPSQAHGLAFSVPRGVPIPPSLQNVYRELQADLGVPIPNHGSLVSWARRGILLLNTTLTVRGGEPRSHQGKGWETLTDQCIQRLETRSQPLVFILWGRNAGEKLVFIDSSRHVVIQSAHPSPFSAHKGFFGSRPFSRANEALKSFGIPPIDWSL